MTHASAHCDIIIRFHSTICTLYFHSSGAIVFPLQEKEAPKISKKKLRKMNRLTEAQLKQLVDRPDVVEIHDVTAQDPKLLVHLKVGRNVCVWVGGWGVGVCVRVCVMHMMTLLKIPSCSSTSKCGGGRGGWCVCRCIHVGGGSMQVNGK